jgi:hypothetical protein
MPVPAPSSKSVCSWVFTTFGITDALMPGARRKSVIVSISGRDCARTETEKRTSRMGRSSFFTDYAKIIPFYNNGYGLCHSERKRTICYIKKPGLRPAFTAVSMDILSPQHWDTHTLQWYYKYTTFLDLKYQKKIMPFPARERGF